MKKAFFLLLALVMCLSVSACAHTHEFGEWTVKNEATCTADGSRVRVCECGEEETEVLPATGHSFGGTVEIMSATCTEAGRLERTCTVCGTVEAETPAAMGHSFGEALEIQAATCTEEGRLERTCTVCGEVEVETPAALGHSFAPATMYLPMTCTACGATEGEALANVIAVGDTVEAENHSFVVESIKFTGSLSDKRGYITYNHSSDYALAIKLDFTNLATEAFERWNSDRAENMSLEYKGKYQYEGECWIPADDIVPLANDALYIVFEVPESMGEDTTSAIYASFTIDGETYAVVIQQGDLSAGEEEKPAETDVSGEIAVGDVLTNNASFSFEVVDLYYTDKPSYKTGNVTYSYSTNGYCLVCKLDFTNMKEEVMKDWNSNRVTDMVLTLADKYTYEGRMWIPTNEIVPLDNGYVFIVFEVAENVETSEDSLVMTFTVDGNKFTVNCR